MLDIRQNPILLLRIILNLNALNITDAAYKQKAIISPCGGMSAMAFGISFSSICDSKNHTIKAPIIIDMVMRSIFALLYLNV